jgi:hypothetical protein
MPKPSALVSAPPASPQPAPPPVLLPTAQASWKKFQPFSVPAIRLELVMPERLKYTSLILNSVGAVVSFDSVSVTSRSNPLSTTLKVSVASSWSAVTTSVQFGSQVEPDSSLEKSLRMIESTGEALAADATQSSALRPKTHSRTHRRIENPLPKRLRDYDAVVMQGKYQMPVREEILGRFLNSLGKLHFPDPGRGPSGAGPPAVPATGKPVPSTRKVPSTVERDFPLGKALPRSSEGLEQLRGRRGGAGDRGHVDAAQGRPQRGSRC